MDLGSTIRSPRSWSESARFGTRWRLHGLRRRFFAGQYERDRRLVFDGDLLLWARLSEFGGARIYVYGSREYYLTRLFKRLVRPGATVVDVGANLGEYTLLAAKHAGATGTVVAFEPLPANFALLGASVAENGFENVILCWSALCDRDGSGALSVPDPSHAGVATLVTDAGPVPSLAVRCKRLDTVVDEIPLDRVDLVKIDVEGLESDVLSGANRTLVRDRPMVLFEVNGLERSPNGITSSSIECLRTLGYELYGVESKGGARWRLVRVRQGEDPSRFRDRWQGADFPPNLLAAHPGDPTAQGCLAQLGL